MIRVIRLETFGRKARVAHQVDASGAPSISLCWFPNQLQSCYPNPCIHSIYIYLMYIKHKMTATFPSRPFATEQVGNGYLYNVVVETAGQHAPSFPLQTSTIYLGVCRSLSLCLQLVVMRWYPGVWGPGHEHDPDAHTSILQEVRPTRTGLRVLASTVAVHRVHRAEAATAKTLAPRRSTTNTKRGGDVVALGRGNAPQ